MKQRKTKAQRRRERIKRILEASVTVLMWAVVAFLMVKTFAEESHISGSEYRAQIAKYAPTQATAETDVEQVEEQPVEATEEEPAEDKPLYTSEELEYLALVIYQEAGADYCSDETRLMVGTVVMNRVADPRFPDSIRGVLTQEGQYGRLHWTGLVWADRASLAVEAHAAERAYKCAEKILSGYRSFGSDVIWQAEFVQGSEIVAYQDGIYFCR